MADLDPRALEAAARAFCKAFGNNPDFHRWTGEPMWTAYTDHAAMAITAYLSALPSEAQALRDRVKVLEGFTKHVAKQVTPAEMDEDYYEAADFEGAYEAIIFEAQAALTEPTNQLNQET